LKDQTIIGADIATHSLYGQGSLHIIALISVLWFVIVYIIGSIDSIKKGVEKLLVLCSIFFLGQYIYYFYISTLIYYVTNIGFLFTNSKPLLALYLIAYLVVITLFYIAGFILFVFEVMTSEHFSFIKLKLSVQKIVILIWSFLLFVGFIYLLNVNKIFDLVVFMIASTILSIVLFRYEKKPAQYILMVNLVLAAFLSIMLIVSLINFKVALIELLSRIILLLLIAAIIVLFRFKIEWNVNSWKKMLLTIGLGIVSGYWFFVLGEPIAPLLFGNIGYIIFFSFLIGFNEELIFRFLLLKVSRGIYSLNASLIIQGIFFGLMHLINFRIFLREFGAIKVVSLTLSLVIFGMLMGFLSIEKVKGKEKINPVYAILCHTIAVLFLNLMA